jgi:ArsR family transcriptional regulator
MKAPVPDSLLIDAAERFRLLGDPVRLRLLNAMLERDEMSVQALAEGGILSCRREGLQALYRVSDPSIPGLCLLVCGQLTAQPQESTAP